MQKALLLLIVLLLSLSTSACETARFGKSSSTAAPTSDQIQAPTASMTQAPTQPPTEPPTLAPTDPPTEPPTDPPKADHSAALYKTLRNGYWGNLVAGENRSYHLDVYTFSDKPIENSDLYYGYSTTYAVMNGAFYKDNAPDNPQYINYGIKDDVISAIGEGGANITFSLSSDGETLTASSGGSSIEYIHYDKLPQTIYEIDPDPY